VAIDALAVLKTTARGLSADRAFHALAVALAIAERVWTIGDLIDAVLPLEPNRLVRVRRNFTVIEGGKS
jgi:hypothetical protein